MPKFAAAIDTLKIPIKSLVPETLGAAPASPVFGQMYADSSNNRSYYWTGTTWTAMDAIDAEKLANKNAPSGYAGLDGGAKISYGVLPVGSTTNTVAAGNDARIVGAQQTSGKDVANGYPGLDASAKILYARIPIGTATNTVAAGDDARITGAQQASGKNAANGYAGLDASTKIAYSQIPTGTATGTVAAADDGRIVNALSRSANLADLANTAAARSNLGLGSAATQNSSAFYSAGTYLNNIAHAIAAVDLNSQRIINLAAPVAATDAARLADVQAAQAGIDSKPSCRIATTANIDLTLTALSAIDGVTPVAGDRILVKNQTDATQNGVYLAATGTWARDSDTINPNSFWFVEEGSTQADTGWVVTNDGAITLGTTALTITQFTGKGTYSGTTNRIVITGNQIDIASNYTGQSTIQQVGTVTFGTWQAGTVAVAYGGTGATEATGARSNLHAAHTGVRTPSPSATVPAGTWTTITHNLGQVYPNVTVYDTITKDLVYLDVQYVDSNTIQYRSGIDASSQQYSICVTPVDI